ncbi:MAG: hypothetical protein AAF289_22040, partial [Cyanobacteria bacterium P01_A01_bin.135]
MANPLSKSEPPVTNSVPHATVPGPADLDAHIQRTLAHIRNKQFTLQAQYGRRQLRQQLERLMQQVNQLEQLQQQVDLKALGLQVYAEDLAEIRNLTNQIKAALDQPDSSIKLASLNLQNAFELLQRLLSDMQADARWPKTSPSATANGSADQLQVLQLALGQQRQNLANSFVGKVLRTAIAKRLNRLAELLHRIDALNHPVSRLRPHRQRQLWALVHQIDQAVDRLDYREASAPDLLEDTAVFVERRLHSYEYPLGLGWFVNRFNDVSRSRSPQSRVLAGLSTSLAMSLALFLASFGAFSLISRRLESNVLTSLRLREERSEVLQALSQQVRLLRDKEQERAANQTSLDNLQVVPQSPTPAAVPDATPGADEAAALEGDEPAPEAGLAPAPRSTEATRELLLTTDQELTAEIQDLRTTIDAQLDEITALNTQIEQARQIEGVTSTANDEQSLKNLYGWLNNQQIINHLNRIILAA